MNSAAQDRVKDFIDSGQQARRRGDRAAALVAFEDAAALAPYHTGIKVETACELRALGRLDEAEARLRDVLAAEPGNISAVVEHAHICRRRGDYTSAAAGFEAAAGLVPAHVGIRLEFARALRALKRLDEAESQLCRLFDLDPGNVGALIERGHLRRLRGDHSGAAVAFGAAAVADPNVDLKLEFAYELRAMDRPDEAEAVLRAVLEADPHRVEALVDRSHLFRRRRDLAGALAALEAAVAAAPLDTAIGVDARLQLVIELRDQGRLDDALRLIESILERYADDAAAWMQLGRLQRARGDQLKALESFQTALDKRPCQTQALVELARENWTFGLPKIADELLLRALTQDPHHLPALIVSAEYALLSADPEKAIVLARRAIDVEPGQVGPYLLGARAAAMFERDAAEALLEQARATFGPTAEITATHIHVLRHYRDHKAARTVIAQAGEQAATHTGLWTETTSFAIMMGDFESAERALRAPPGEAAVPTARTHGLRGQLAETRRQYEQAAAHYRCALALDPAEPEWHGSLARCCLLLADTDGAREHLRASVKADTATRVASGHSLNISQHHLGQILDEFILDQPVLKRMREILALPLDARIGPLKDVVRQNPDHTPPAILLLLTMRQTGLLGRTQSEPGTNRHAAIPKRIAQYWHTKEPPSDVQDLMASWGRAHPDYERVIFDDATALTFLRSHGPDDALHAFRRARDVPQRADILRLAYLASEGGIFVDADDRCLAPLDSYMPTSTKLVGYQETLGTLGTNFIGATRSHPMILHALALAVEAINRGDHDIVWLSTGPGLLTRAFAQMVLQPNFGDQLNETLVLELHGAHRVVGVHCPARYKKSNGRRLHFPPR